MPVYSLLEQFLDFSNTVLENQDKMKSELQLLKSDVASWIKTSRTMSAAGREGPPDSFNPDGTAIKGGQLSADSSSNEKENFNHQKFKTKRIRKISYVWKEFEALRKESVDEVPSDFVNNPLKFEDEQINYHERMPISCDGKYAAYIGKFPGRVGSRPHKVYKPDAALNMYYDLRGKSLSLPNPDNYRVVSGSWDTNRSYCQLMADTSRKGREFSKESVSAYLPIIQRYIAKLGIRKIFSPTVEDLKRAEVSVETDSGPRWHYLMKMPKKRDCLPYALNVSKRAMHETFRGNWVPQGLYSVGGREVTKDDAYEDDEEITSRGVLMPETHEFLLETIYSRPIEKFFFNLQKGPIYLGQSMKHNGWHRLEKDLMWGEKVLEGDWKKYDTSVSNELIVLGMCILRLFYRRGKEIDFMFMRFISNLTYKKVVTPGGFMYQFSSSVPSGSSWTSILTSIINFLILSRVCHDKFEIRNHKEVRFVIGGDDHLIIFKNFSSRIQHLTSFGEDFLKEEIEKITGMVLKNFMICDPFPEDIARSPSFFKTIVYRGAATIRPDHLVELIYAPKSARRKKWRPIEYLLDIFGQGPAPFSHFKWVFDYLFLKEFALNPCTKEEVSETYRDSLKRSLNIVKGRMNRVSNTYSEAKSEGKRSGKVLAEEFVRERNLLIPFRQKELNRSFAMFGFIKERDQAYRTYGGDLLKEESSFIVFE